MYIYQVKVQREYIQTIVTVQYMRPPHISILCCIDTSPNITVRYGQLYDDLLDIALSLHYRCLYRT